MEIETKIIVKKKKFNIAKNFSCSSNIKNNVNKCFIYCVQNVLTLVTEIK